MRKVELLAPAGSIESLYAAVNSGADAVYLGGNKFSARAYASNFDEEKMKEAVIYCHIYGVKVHVTINTLLKDSEIEEALDYAGFLHSIGVDALIIQDIGFAAALKKRIPDFELHGSTQMTVHNLEGALFLKELGFKRVVLSRELSLKEIKEIVEKSGVEIEIFIHGALCICYSGQCLMSSVIGGRSGNRGRCAQPCRLPYTLRENISKEEKKAYILSPKDICTLDSLKEIVDSGTASLKIEGRMKRPEYVAGVTGAYRLALDSIYKLKDFDIKHEEEKLLQLFNREGFSRAYLFGNSGIDMMAYKNPKNTGLKLGVVDADLEIKLLSSLSIKDGISIGEKGFAVSKITVNGSENESAAKGDRVKIFPLRYKKGDVLYKTSDNSLNEDLTKSFENPYEKKVEVGVKIYFETNKKIQADVLYKKHKFKVYGDVVQEPVKHPIEKAKLIENICKTQNTPFAFNIEVISFEPGFIPVSAINELRRNIINKIHEIEGTLNREMLEVKLPGLKKQADNIPKALVVVSTHEQLKAANEMGLPDIAIDIFNKNNTIEIPKNNSFNLYLKIPNIIKEEFHEICNIIDENINNISGIVTGNLGIISRYYSKTQIIGDYKLNILNRNALEFYNNYNGLSCVSVELNRSEIREMLKSEGAQFLVYGKVEIMVSEYCMAGSAFGGKSNKNACSGPCKNGDFTIKDRMGIEFKVSMDKYCRNHILNNAPLNLIQNIEELKSFGAECFRLDFIDEDYTKTKEILESFKLGKFEESFENYTRGHYKRGVE